MRARDQSGHRSALALELQSDPRAVTVELKRLARGGVDLSQVLLRMQMWTIEGNVYHYNTAISACQGPLWQSALHLLRRMSAQLVPADAVSHNAAIAAVGPQWRRGVVLFNDSDKEPIAFNSLLSAWSKVGSWELGQVALSQMMTDTVQPDLISFTSSLDACSRAEHWRAASCLLKQMSQRWVSADTVAWNCATSSGRVVWQKALQALGCMQQTALPPDVVSFDIAVDHCAGQWQKALGVMLRMQLDTCHPTTVTFDAAISVCEAHWRTALGLLGALLAGARPLPDVVTYNSAASCCQKAMQWLEALEALRSMSGLQGDSFTCSAALGACRDSWQLAVALVERMGQCAQQPHTIVLNALTSACGQGGQWQLAVQTLSAGDGFTYAAAISACEKARQWQRALWLLQHMQATSLETDAVCFAAAISACESASRWQHAALLWQGMAACRVQANTVCRLPRWERRAYFSAPCFFGAFILLAPFCFSAGKKERNKEATRTWREQDSKPQKECWVATL